MMSRAACIFYHAQDEAHARKLRTHLAPLRRRGTIATFDVSLVLAGEDVKERIEQEIARASLLLVLVSPEFLDSCWDGVEEALRDRRYLVPVLVRPAGWRDTELGGLAALPKDGRPVSLWPNADQAWQDVVEGLRDLVAQMPAPAEAAQRSAAPLPAAPRCYGRDPEIESLTAALLEQAPALVPILGGGGLGKTTLALAALHDRRVGQRYAGRRYFVRCDGCQSREAVVLEVARAMGLELGPHLEARVMRELASAPAAVVLDNAETPWETDRAGVEDFMGALSAVPGLALLITLRGAERPAGPAWREALWVGPLSPAAARDAFLAVAGRRYRDDPCLERRLEAVDRVPLAIVLLGRLAEGSRAFRSCGSSGRSSAPPCCGTPPGRTD